MEVLDIHTTLTRYDPTHTTPLRNAFSSAMKRRFQELTSTIRIGVDKRDCFGLKDQMHTLQMLPPSYRQFAYLRDPEKVDTFMKWLE